METRRNQIILGLLLVALIVATRLMPHLPNFTPVAAVALFAGVYLRKSWAIGLPIAGMILSDIFIGGDSWRGRLVIYSSLALVGLIGWAVSRKRNIGTILAGSLGGSIAFFLITNCVLFYAPTMYSHDIAGQISSYVNALPFFRYTLMGDLFYAGVLFGGYAFVRRYTRTSVQVELSSETVKY